MPHEDSAPRETKPRQGGETVSCLDLFRQTGRSIIISGGGGGLGLTTADTVLEAGGDVVCLDLQQFPPAEAWSALEAKAARVGGQISYYSCDATKSDAVAAAFATFVPKLRYHIRGLVACVGQSDTGPSVDYPADKFLRILEINILSTYIMAQAVAREMQAKQVDGAMVLIASMSGWNANKGADSSAYNTAKSGIHQLSRSLASEWGSREGMPLIRVNSISPGYIRTSATRDALAQPGMDERWSEQNMLYRISYPDEFRGPIMFLLSDASSFVTATDLRVDGGHCAW